jgi:hypothetical protein
MRVLFFDVFWDVRREGGVLQRVDLVIEGLLPKSYLFVFIQDRFLESAAREVTDGVHRVHRERFFLFHFGILLKVT